MQISTRFTMAVHIFACIGMFGDKQKITSDFLASSINANPVIVRRLLGKLKAAGLVEVSRGSGGGAKAARPLDKITFLDIYNAVERTESGSLFNFHENPNPLCPVGRNIRGVLDSELCEIRLAMEKKMRGMTMAQVTESINAAQAAANKAENDSAKNSEKTVD